MSIIKIVKQSEHERHMMAKEKVDRLHDGG